MEEAMARSRQSIESPPPSLQDFKAEIFKALSHPTRIRILEVLRERQMSVSDLGNALGLDISNVSQHLTVLRHKGILVGHKEGLTIYYRVTNKRLYKILDLFRDWFNEHMQSRREMYDALEL
jgi:ArsR family transcriptional regulator